MKIHRILFLLVLFIIATQLSGEEVHPLAGHWEGTVKLQPGIDLAVLIDFAKEADGKWKGTIDIPAQAAKGLPLANIEVKESKVSFEIENVPGKPTFSGEITQDKIAGNFTQSGQNFTFELHRKLASATAPKKPEQETLQEIRTLVKAQMEQWHVPGLSLAIVKNGKVLLVEGFGYRNVKNKQPVTPDTLFAIGSSTKAFTATLLGIAVDEGKLKWDEPVRTYLPGFAMQDEFASERMTPADLITHQSGLPRHDVLWYNNQFDRRQLFERLKYLQPNEDFREIFQYQNLMFMTAGYLAGEVAGKSWEDLVREKIFQPLGMSSSNLSVDDSKKASDHALPYRYDDEDEKKKKKGELKEIPFRNINAIGPAGSINSNIRDMARWTLMNLGGGTFEGKTIISKNQLEEIHSPHIVIRGGIWSQLFTFPETPYTMYGMGWIIQPYRGYRLLHHGGNIDGFSAMVSFMPDEKYGVVILTNLDGNLMVDSFMFELYDRLLRLEPVDWNSRFKLRYEQFKVAAQESENKEVEILKKAGTKPTHVLSDYVGTYESESYGKVKVSQEGQKLKVSYGELSSPLEHWHFDIFNATEDPVKGTKVSFLSNVRGDVDRLSMPMEPSVAEIIFTMKAPESMYQPSFLQRFVGEYDLLGLTVTVALIKDQLTLTVPGQPTYQLEPYRGTEFNLKDQPGYSVRFLAKEVIFIQPGAVLTAKKK
jgi:CubicO group peptidase (beta-lactamase class C family)